MEVRVIDKRGVEIGPGVLTGREEVLEALGFGELYRELREVERWEPAKAIAALVKRGHVPSPQGDGSWLAYLGDDVELRLKREQDGGWVAEFALPIEYDKGTVLILDRLRLLGERVERLERAVKWLEDALRDLEKALAEREGKGRLAERLAEALERIAEALERGEERG
jgi:exonuclease VII small subunit